MVNLHVIVAAMAATAAALPNNDFGPRAVCNKDNCYRCVRPCPTFPLVEPP